MADQRYLKKRRQGWYFVMAVPLELRGKFPGKDGKPIGKIVLSLGTRDLTLAQKKRWALVDQYTEAFRRASGDIALTRAEIDEQAKLIYHDTLVRLEADARAGKLWAETQLEGDNPEVVALEMGIETLTDALSDAPDFTITTGLDGEGEDNLVAADIEAVERRTGAKVAPRSETYALLGEAILKAKIAAMTGRQAALQDRPSEAPPVFVSGGIDRVTLRPVAVASRPKIRIREGGGKTVSEAASEYIAELQRDANAKLTEQTRGQHEMAFRLFGQYVRDASLASIDRSMASEFLGAISKLDPTWGRSPQTKELTVWQLLDQFGDGDRQLSNRTVNRYTSSLSSLFKWTRRRGYFDDANPFSEQSRPKARKGATGWLPYNIDELSALFGSPLFTEIDTKKRLQPTRHTAETALLWVPLIALFSGMRLGEICQLRTGDLKRDAAKIWFFNVTEEGENQQVKTEAGIRRVPVHSMLVRCGLLDYAKALPPGRLFPGLSPGGPDGKLGWYFTRRYTEYRRSVGIDRPRLAFHSFRKNVSTVLDNVGVPQSDLAALIGHERGFTFDTYSKGLELERLRGITEKIQYSGLRLTHLHIL